MKIAMISGSPKPGKSNSDWFLEQLEGQFTETHEVMYFNPAKNPAVDIKALLEADVIVVSFPLYVDSVPAHLFRMMADVEQYTHHSQAKDIYVYAISNNGFFEGKQNYIALDIVRNWCFSTGFTYGQGIGQGAGEMIGSLKSVPLGQGPLKNLGNAMQTLAQNIERRNCGENILVNPNFPRLAFHLSSTYGFWNRKAKQSGSKIRDIKKRVNQ